MKNLIICDIDNTLLPAGGKISAETERVIRELGPDTGFSIATGRSFHVVRKFVEDLSISVPVITSNGAQIYDYAEDRPVFESSFSEETTSEIIRMLLDSGFDFVAYGKDGIFYRPGSTHLAFFHNYNASVRAELSAPLLPLSEKHFLSSDTSSGQSFRLESLTKILVYFPTDDLISRLSSHPDLEVTSSMHHVVDVMPQGSTKGNAVVSLAEYLRVPLDHVYCFGDNDNDISMFTCGAVGIAMGNADDNTKGYASLITRTCKDDGVAYAIRHLLKL